MKLPKLTLASPKLNWVSSMKQRLAKIFRRLNLSQALFIMATPMLALSNDWGFAGLLIVIGLALEFWPKFIQLWHSLPGKGLIFFCYAFVANFALVSAAGVINDITGVNADHLSYTHNFAILLYLPIWIIGFTFIALLFLQITLPLYLLLLVLLKPFGLRAVKLVTSTSYPLLTGILRLTLSAILLSQISLHYQDEIIRASGQIKIDLDNALVISGNEDSLQELQGAPQLPVRLEKDKPAKKILNYQDFVVMSLNIFIYQFESDQFSRCHISDNARVIELNDYEVLEVTRDNAAKFGYAYQVKACVSPAMGH